jgi:hypothetical protein|tara:strand:- start:523 stop:681 length:159 start_codon:yes stop_codon:yes gene_type:complete
MKITHLKKFNREDTPKFLKKENLISVELGVVRGDFSKELSKSFKLYTANFKD